MNGFSYFMLTSIPELALAQQVAACGSGMLLCDDVDPRYSS